MGETAERIFRKIGVPLAVAVCLLMSAMVVVDYVTGDKFGNDFGVYWRAANQPVEEAYLWRGRFPFPYAPTMLLFIQPLAFVPKWLAYALLTCASLVAFVLVFRRYLTKAALALALISPLLLRGIFTGQVSALLAALMLSACATERRTFAGIVFGVIAAIKPQLVVMAPLLFVLNRDWKAFFAAGTTLVVLVLVSLLFGPERWTEWVASMGHFQSAVANTPVINQAFTPAAVATRFDYWPLPFMLAGTLIGAWVIWMSRNAEPLEMTAAITLASMLAAPYAMSYDLTAVVPFLALCVLRGRIWAVLALAASLPPLPLIVSTYELVKRRLPTMKQAHAA